MGWVGFVPINLCTLTLNLYLFIFRLRAQSDFYNKAKEKPSFFLPTPQERAAARGGAGPTTLWEAEVSSACSIRASPGSPK